MGTDRALEHGLPRKRRGALANRSALLALGERDQDPDPGLVVANEGVPRLAKSRQWVSLGKLPTEQTLDSCSDLVGRGASELSAFLVLQILDVGRRDAKETRHGASANIR